MVRARPRETSLQRRNRGLDVAHPAIVERHAQRACQLLQLCERRRLLAKAQPEDAVREEGLHLGVERQPRGERRLAQARRAAEPSRRDGESGLRRSEKGLADRALDVGAGLIVVGAGGHPVHRGRLLQQQGHSSRVATGLLGARRGQEHAVRALLLHSSGVLWIVQLVSRHSGSACLAAAHVEGPAWSDRRLHRQLCRFEGSSHGGAERVVVVGAARRHDLPEADGEQLRCRIVQERLPDNHVGHARFTQLEPELLRLAPIEHDELHRAEHVDQRRCIDCTESAIVTHDQHTVWPKLWISMAGEVAPRVVRRPLAGQCCGRVKEQLGARRGGSDGSDLGLDVG